MLRHVSYLCDMDFAWDGAAGRVGVWRGVAG